jgi:hypothetical protein
LPPADREDFSLRREGHDMQKGEDPTDPQHIFRQLKKGLGHALVNEGNVDELIAIAQQHGHRLVEIELREWKSLCGSDLADTPELPLATAPPKPPRHNG